MRKFTFVLMMLILILSSLPTEAADLYVVAIFDMKAEEGVSSQTALLLSNLLRKDLAASHKMTVMDRNDMDAILQAQGENLRDCTEEGCAVRLGKILDTDKIIVGNISMLGSRYMLYAKMVDIESGVMMFAKNVQASSDEGELVDYIAELADKISGEITLTGKVLQVSPTEVLVDLGKDVGIRNGAALIVDRKGEAILDPQTGEVKGYHWDEIARLRVIGSAGESISRCQVISTTAEALPGDRVREYEFGGVIREKGDVVFLMEPGEVYAVIDGSPSGMISVPASGRMKMKFTPGAHTFAFSRTGKQDWEKEVVVRAGDMEEVQVDFVSGESRIEESSGYGILVVRSNPSGAAIFIDGIERGVTTHQVKEIAAGTHQVEIIKSLYKPYKETIVVESDDVFGVDATLEPDFGRLTIESAPPGAMVYIDGQQRDLTPYDVERYQSGEYDLRLVKQLFHEHSQKFTVNAGGATPISVSLKPAFGSLEITSDPPGAEVYLDERPCGMTPMQKDTVISGRHTVMLRMDMFNDYEEIVTVHDGEITVVDAVLSADFGTVDITSDPSGADVYIAGQAGRLGRTPMTKKLKPGIYRFQLQKELYESFEQTVNLAIGDYNKITPELVRKTGRLVIFTDPPDADVYLAGKHLGKSPQIIRQLPTGIYEVLLKIPQYADHRETVEIKYKDETNVDAKLSKTAYLAHKKRKSQALLMSFVLPGSGQVRSRQPMKGLLYMAAFAGAGWMAYDNQQKYDQAEGDYNTAKVNYENASNQLTLNTCFDQMQSTHSDMDNYDLMNKVFLGAAAGIWAWNMIDVIIWGGGKAETYALDAGGESPVQFVTTPNKIGIAIKF